MATSITFDFLSRGAASLAHDFRSTGDNAALAAKGAKVLQGAIESLGTKEGRTAEESRILAKALRETGAAEDRVTAKAVLADAAVRRLDDDMKKAAKKREAELKVKVDDSELKKALKGLSAGPGLLGPAVALAPAAGVLAGVATGAAAGLAGAFVAGGLALAAFGAVAKPVLTDAKTAATAVEKAQNAYTVAIAHGTKQSVAYKAEQVAIAKAYANLSPAQIALSRQLGAMASSWDAVKAAQTPVIAGALQPWLKSVTGLTSALGPIIAKVAPVIGDLGTQFGALVSSTAFTQFRDFIGSTGAAAVSAGGSTIIDLVKSFMILLPKFDPLIREAVGWISRLGPAVLTWASSKKASDDITKFMQWFSQNGPVVGGLLKNIGGALKALAPGLTSGGTLELKVISGFLGLVAKLPPALAKPLAEVAGAALILSKLGVLKVGLKVAGPALKWLSGGLINLGGGATAGAEIRAAMVSGGAAAAAEIRAAMVGGGAAGGAEGAAGGAAAGRVAGGGFVTAFAAAAGPALSGVLSGLLIRAVGNTLSPAGTFAGNLNKQFQSDGQLWSTSLLHSFTFGGLEGWLTTKIGAPVGGALNNVGSGAKLWAQGFAQSVGGFFASIGKAAATAFGHAGDSADTLRTRNLTPLLGEVGKVSGGVQGLSGIIQGTMLNALRAAGQRSDAIRTQNLEPLRGELGRVTGGVQGLQHYIDLLHGKNVTVGVTGTGKGGVVITSSGSASVVGGGGIRFTSGAARGLFIDRGAGPTADDVMIRASKGELIVPANMVQAGAVDHLRGRIPGFASGGFVGVENALGRVTGVASGLEGRGAAAAAAAAVKAALAKAKAAVAQAATFAGAGASGTRVPNVGSGVSRWAPLVRQALAMEHLNPNDILLVLYQMLTESGGNPNAINLTDSNAAAGTPSKGLMQVIGPTFARWHWPGTSGNIYDPLANIAAALNYASHGRGIGTGPGQLGSGHGYAEGGLVPGYASGGVTAAERAGQTYLNAWRSRRGGPWGSAHGPVALNRQIAARAAAERNAQILSRASGLTSKQHKHYAAAAVYDAKRLAVLKRERAVERTWRGQLAGTDTTLARDIAAAGNIPGLAKNVKAWKAQEKAHEYTIGQISGMLGLTGAQQAAAHPPVKGKVPVVTGVQATHTYGGDVADTIGAFLASVAAPFGAARGGLVFDRGGWLKPGWNATFNGTGRAEHLVPSRGGGGDVHLHLTVNAPVGSQAQLEDWYVKTANKLARHGRLSQAVKAASR